MHTTDGGESWNSSEILGIPECIYFTSKDTGYCGTYYNSFDDIHFILKTINGGDNWEIIYTDSLPFNSISFTNSLNGFAIASTYWDGSIFISTTDAGITWERHRYPRGYQFCSLEMLNDSLGYIAGGHPEKIWENN